ncbi:MAG TPA: chorismate mutase [Thermoplasmata archaeon]|nr:chorismate mutase [Thermoplasmata archaeon]
MVNHSSVPPPLASVRRDLERIDRAIVILVAARLDAACSAIRLRSQIDGRVADPSQEGRVIARARVWAEQLGVSPVLIEELFRAIVEAGKHRYSSRTVPLAPSRRSAGTRHARVHVPSPRAASTWARSSPSSPA